MNQKNKIKKSLFQSFLEKVFGIQNISLFFSYEGVIDRNQFFITFLTFGAISKLIELFRLPILTYGIKLSLFYCILAAIQKRSRDIGKKGTLFVALYTGLMILITAFNDTDIMQKSTFLNLVVLVLLFIWIGIFIFLSYKNSKPDADKELRSPLLKYPLLYVGICWILAITATLAVNHYAGVKVPLF